MKIAVAIDGSENALRAAKYAVYLTQHIPNPELYTILVTIIIWILVSFFGIMKSIFVADFNKAKGDFLLAQHKDSFALKYERKVQPVLQLAEAAKIRGNVVLLKGNPSLAIIHYVNEQTIRQLIMGSRGLNSFQERLLGSVSHKVVKHVNCPVTVVK